MDPINGEEAVSATPEQELDDAINQALECAVEDVDKSRENALVITKLEEARSWNTLDIQRKENN